MYDMTLYAILMAVFAVGMTGLAAFLGKKQGLNPAGLCLYGALSAVLGMLIGRGIHCAVCWYEVFFDPMGDFLGVKAFFDPTIGGVNVIGVMLGVLLAAPIAAAIMKEKTADDLDAAAIPALGMYILARVIEPLTGQGYGDFMEMYVSVCYLEAALTAVVLGAVILLQKKVRRPGTLFRYALVLWALVQIFPEGHNTPDGKIHPFYPSYLVLALMGNAPIIPVISDGNYGINKRLHVLIGEPIDLHDHFPGGKYTQEDLDRVNELIYQHVLQLRALLDQKIAANRRNRKETA